MRTIAIVLLGSGMCFGGDLKTVLDLQSQNARYQLIIGEMSKEKFSKMAFELLGPGRITVGVVAAYGSLRDRAVAGPGRVSDCGYNLWRLQLDNYDIAHSGCPEVQEAVKIGNSILLRTVDRECRRNLSLLAGKDNPLHLVVNGNKAELLHLSFSRPTGKANEHRTGASACVRIKGVVSATLARAVTAQIKNMTGIDYLGVVVRSDLWFINEGYCPALFPFENQPPLPSKEQYSHTKYAVCYAADRWPIQCFESWSVP